MNIGSSSSPNYQLSVQSLNYAPDTIQLTDTANSQTLLTQLTPGAYVEYQVNGQPTQPIDSTTRNVVISPGLTVNLQATGSTTVTVAQNGSSVLNALSSLVSAYNTALDELGKQRGQNGGALTGEGIVYSLTMALQNLANYSAPGGNLQNMSDIGLEFDQTGHLTLDATTFNQAAATNMSDVLNFLGSASGQTGFIGAASSVLTGINDSTNGILPQETTTLGNELTTLGNQINDDQTNVNQLQSNLTAQMAAADASIATLEQQSSYLQMMFQTENANAQLGY
jgi:flagellar hook-associated protein 2